MLIPFDKTISYDHTTLEGNNNWWTSEAMEDIYGRNYKSLLPENCEGDINDNLS